MWLLILAMRRPHFVLVGIISIVLAAWFALTQMPIDIFPNLGVPVIYVSQPYGGMTPAQMEGYISSPYEYHFLYVNGIRSVESKNVQGAALYKLTFHPGTDMAEAMSETVAEVNRSRALMPPGTIPPFILRFDAGSMPVGYLVLSSEARSIGEIQDLALYKIRPIFASLQGVSSPPPFGGNARTIVINIDPDRLRNYNLSPEQVIQTLNENHQIIPAGNIGLGKYYPLTPVNGTIEDIQELAHVPIKVGAGPTIFLQDVGWVEDSTDITTGYALVNGRRSIYIPVAKRADASTWSVVQSVRRSMQRFQDAVPKDVKVSYEFDQSSYVRNALVNLGKEGTLGAVLTGLMILLFLHSWRSTLVVVANIPIAILFSLIMLSVCGQTVNIMTLGGLALAIGILVDEATIVIENIHTHLDRGEESISRAVKDSAQEISLPRLLVLLCILAVFLPSFFMKGIPRALFIPLSLSVGFAMVGSYVLSQTLVPVLATWFLKHSEQTVNVQTERKFSFTKFQDAYISGLHQLSKHRKALIVCYAIVVAIVSLALVPRLGSELFPSSVSNQFRFRLRAMTGTRIEETERLTKQALRIIQQEAGGKQNVNISIAYVGQQPSSYAVNNIYLWTSGPHEAVVTVQLSKENQPSIEQFKERLRQLFRKKLPDTNVSFEPADLISQILSLDSPTPVEVAITGKNLKDCRQFSKKILRQFATLPYLRDVQYGQALDYPSLDIKINREMAGQLGVTLSELKGTIVAATSSSRFILPVFWLDRMNGHDYQVQVQIPQPFTTSINDIQNLPAMPKNAIRPLLGDLAEISQGQIVGEFDHLNNQRMITLTANLFEKDLGHAANNIQKAISHAGKPPRGVITIIRGQIQVLIETLIELRNGLLLSIVAIFLMLTANFQSFKLAFAAISTVPAVLCGVVAILLFTGTTINLQSAMGSIMAIGVAVSNAILFITVAEEYRHLEGLSSMDAALKGAHSRIRPILMTSLAMTAGMIPMALGLGEGGEQTAPLGRAVIGGLVAATITNLTILPFIFSIVQEKSTALSSSLDPDDPSSQHFKGISP